MLPPLQGGVFVLRTGGVARASLNHRLHAVIPPGLRSASYWRLDLYYQLGFAAWLRYGWGMNETEQAVLATLLDLEEKVAQMRTANPKPNLLPVFDRLDVLARELPPGTDPELLHFLHKKSYEKARMLLQGMEPKKGSCRK